LFGIPVGAHEEGVAAGELGGDEVLSSAGLARSWNERKVDDAISRPGKSKKNKGKIRD
jgi:hypothetical protein